MCEFVLTRPAPCTGRVPVRWVGDLGCWAEDSSPRPSRACVTVVVGGVLSTHVHLHPKTRTIPYLTRGEFCKYTSLELGVMESFI